ncbi:MAG TPA: DUF3467 domain-containing protein [Candidatus Acidoferrales bacterium]|nr:DUF3467 domain-containing protein [Candidatus Acidoferrales bacterium]
MSDLPIQVKVQESASQVIYTDAVLVNGSPLGFVLNFGQWAPEQPGLLRVYTRVGMSPSHLKLLAQLLNENVAGYEANFGSIVVAEEREAPHKHIGFSPKPTSAPR